MIRHSKTFYLGIFLVLIPLLGLPVVWKYFLIIVSGLGMIASSVDIDTSFLSQRPPVKKYDEYVEPKVLRRPRKKEKAVTSPVEQAPQTTDVESDDVTFSPLE